MYEKDKRNRITIRLNNEQFACVSSKSDILGISPSDFIRMLINSLIFTEKQQGKAEAVLTDNQPTEQPQVKQGGLGRENDKTDKHD